MTPAMIGAHYDPTLVTLSVLVAILASYTALDLSCSVLTAKGRARKLWLAAGSLAMGCGIWSMHFIGMLSFKMPGMRMEYDTPLLILSILIAIAASGLALYVVSHRRVSKATLSFAGLAMGVAIAGMHYTGMTSMRMPARILWNPWLVLLSIAIAVSASFAALKISFQLRHEDSSERFKLQLGGGILMGFAISGMHYTGMAAATFVAAPLSLASASRVVATSTLAIFIAVVTVLILGLALVGSIVERALTRKTEAAEANRELYQEAENALGTLREERVLRERFVFSLTHDLRTPLTAAKLNAQLLDRKLKNVDLADKKHLFKIVENIERADEMIHNLLDVQRISASQALPLQPEKVDLADIVRRTVQNLEAVHGERFVVRAPEKLVGSWDPQYLQRLIENLCSNAIKYGESGQPITLTLEETSADAVLRVHNYGEAISPEEQQNLFRLFHRAASAQKSGNAGWGIGLTLVKGVAEAHGGNVSIQSSAREGTSFIVRLPKAGPASKQKAA